MRACGRRATTTPDAVPTLTTFDYAVVGGGIVGAAVAYGLAKAGEEVALLDEGDIAFRAARGNFGNVWVQGKGANAPAYADLTREAANGWAAFAEELQSHTGIDLHFRRPGAFYLCFSEQELEKRTAIMAKIEGRSAIPSPFEVLDHGGLARRLPEIGPAIAGGTYSAADGTANPLLLLRSMIAALCGLGGSYLPKRSAKSVRAEGGGFVIDTQDGPIGCANVVLAAGLGNAELAPQLGMSAPVRPVRGQIMVTEKVRPFLNFGTNFIRQTVEGGCIFGESSEEVGLDDATTLPVLRETARRAALAFPLLCDVRVVRSWGALRIMTDDGVPVYQQAPAHPGAFVLSVHSGVTLAPFHAEGMVQAIRARHLDPARFQSFSPERFHVQTS